MGDDVLVFRKRRGGFFSFLKRKKKVGLALGGGGAKGFAHFPIVNEMVYQGVKFDYVSTERSTRTQPRECHLLKGRNLGIADILIHSLPSFPHPVHLSGRRLFSPHPVHLFPFKMLLLRATGPWSRSVCIPEMLRLAAIAFLPQVSHRRS